MNRNTASTGTSTMTAAVICSGHLVPAYESLKTDSPTSRVRMCTELEASIGQ